MPTWTNRSLNISIQPHRIVRPQGYGDVAGLVAEALRLGRRVHAVGRGWSFTDVATTTDFMIDTRGLRGILAFSQRGRVWGHRIEDHDTVDDPHVDDDPLPAAGYPADRSWALAEALLDGVRSSDRMLAHVLAGTTVRELYEALDTPARDRPVAGAPARDRWALPTMGGASGQTVAGAIGTGTHGGDFELPPMADMVRAIHLIAPDGSQRWIEPAQGAITDPNRLVASMRGVPRENIHYDDDMFAAALVSLGSLGVMFSLVLEVRRQYGLSEIPLPRTNYAAVRAGLLDGSVFGDGRGDPAWLAQHPAPAQGPKLAKSFGLFINPYRADGDYARGDGHAQRSVRVFTQAEAPAVVGPEREPVAGVGPLDGLHIIKDFESAGDLRTTAAVVERVLDLLRAPNGTSGYRRASSVLDTTSETQPVLSLEIVVTTANGRHIALLDDMLARFDAIMREQWGRGRACKFAGALALRFTRPTRALLGMQAPTGAADERFCHIEIPVVKEVDIFGAVLQGHDNLENDSELFVAAFEAAADEHGARMHWGQISTTGLHRADRYPAYARLTAVRDRLTHNGAIHTFDCAFPVRAGLLRLAPSWALRSGIVPAPPPTQAPGSTLEQGRFPSTTLLNPTTHCLELYTIAGDGQVARCVQRSPNAGWGAWELLPAQVRFKERAAVASDGTIHYVFARTAEGDLWQSNSEARPGPWSNGGWGRFGGQRVLGSPAAISDALHERWPYVFARCTDGRIRCVTLSRTFTRAGHFGDWETLPVLPAGAAGDPALAIVDRRIEVYVRATDGSVWRNRQPADGGWGWSEAWTRMGEARLAGDPVVARHADGRLELLGRGSDGRLWVTWQDRPAGSWMPWEHLGAANYPLATDTPPSAFATADAVGVAVRDAQRRLHVLVFGRGHGWRDAVVGEAGPTTTGAPSLGASADGRFELFSRTAHDLVTHRWELAIDRW